MGLVSRFARMEAEKHDTTVHTGQGRLVVLTNSYTREQHLDLLWEQIQKYCFVIRYFSYHRKEHYVPSGSPVFSSKSGIIFH